MEIGSPVNDPAFETIARIAAGRAVLTNFTTFDDIGEDAEAENAEAPAKAALSTLLEKVNKAQEGTALCRRADFLRAIKSSSLL